MASDPVIKAALDAAFRDAPDTRESGGATYRKDRIGHTLRNGQFPLTQLRRDEFVVAPGIIYRKEARDAHD